MTFDVGGRRLPAFQSTAHTFEIDTALYSVPAVHRACYALAEHATFDLVQTGRGLSLRVTAREGAQLEVVLDDLKRQLVDFALREEIEARTKGLRDLIWRTAFAEMRGRGGS